MASIDGALDHLEAGVVELGAVEGDVTPGQLARLGAISTVLAGIVWAKRTRAYCKKAQEKAHKENRDCAEADCVSCKEKRECNSPS